ncbi:hypothetical protein NS319_07195 [Sphingomonas sanguinis]|uniref:Uncharacterized protein n=1 Tax=Sphingomonas sanguinis TaxID=33051 RepID=A0A147I0D4_9SPHN|nr:hypothetical protein NS319_07195 [Sphingomonas sanguinis]
MVIWRINAHRQLKPGPKSGMDVFFDPAGLIGVLLDGIGFRLRKNVRHIREHNVIPVVRFAEMNMAAKVANTAAREIFR